MKSTMAHVLLLTISAVLITLITSCAAPPPAPAPAPTAAAPTVPPTVAPKVEPSVIPTAVPTEAPKVMPAPTLASKNPPSSVEEIQVISPEGLKALIDGKADVVVVDNQPKEAYVIGHIPGAVNLPWEVELSAAGDLPKDKLLILYCPCENEEDASDVAMQLVKKFGYKTIMMLDGGWLRWQELGYPVETS